MSLQELTHEARTEVPASAESRPDVAPVRKRGGHLYELDIVRIVTFAGVIFDHCVSGTTEALSTASNAVQMFFHYTRNAFFALTGFVLVYQYRDRELKASTFWRRRFKLIGLPYVTWSVFYWVFGIYSPRYAPPSFSHFGEAFGSISATVDSVQVLLYSLATGNAWYHLYFVFVTMQVYLLFPLLLRFLRWSWGYHRYLLAASLVFHLGLLHLMHTGQPPFAGVPVLDGVWKNLHHTIFPYQFYTLAGAIAAMHVEAFRAWIVAQRKAVIAVTGVVVAVAVGYFVTLVDGGVNPGHAANVFRPSTTFLFVGVVLSLFAAGTIWSERRTKGSFWDKFLAKASDRSFGIFLVHALALHLLAPGIHLIRFSFYPPIVTGVVFVATVLLTVLFVEILRRSPLSLITTGREKMTPKPKTPSPKQPELVG